VFGQAILDKVACTTFDRHPYLKGDFDNLYVVIIQRDVNVTPLENKVEGLIHQACDLKALQESYSGRTTTKEQDNYRIEA